jgi:hypothetical protein
MLLTRGGQLRHVILVMQEGEIRRITVEGQPSQGPRDMVAGGVRHDPISKIPNTQKGW